ncbi:MAG: molybdopterin cofactor-binding domain-containing protein [Nitriliruptoraceae bacterium]
MAQSIAGVSLTVNGRDTTADADLPLLSVLRDNLGLTGARQGCGVGDCGACTVLVDGEPVRACITPCGDVAEQQITTPEGLGTPDDPHPVQRAFLDLQAAECGYCINGMIMTVAGLALSGAAADDAAVTDALDGHLCRCGTHPRILQAARRALGLGDGALSDDGLWCDHGGRAWVESRPDGTAASRELPPMIADGARVESWFRLASDGTIQFTSGRSEIGQGVWQGLRQIAAAHLGVDAEVITLIPASTANAVDEGYTAGSRSMSQAGPAIAAAAAAFRRLVLARAAASLPSGGAQIVAGDDGKLVVVDAADNAIALRDLAAEGPITGEITSDDLADWQAEPIGAPLPRVDLATKLTGASAFLHDLAPAGMLHARAVLPPTLDAELDDVDTTKVAAMPGVVDVVRDGRLLLVLAETQPQAIAAAAALDARARWSNTELAFAGDAISTLRAAAATRLERHSDDGVDEALARGTHVEATYSMPYQSHASLAPSAAIAQFDGDEFVVWAHVQGMHPLRRELAALFEMDEQRITVHFAEGAGCYGHNGSDDAAALAAFAARAVPGQPVRLQFSLADEFLCETYGSAAAVTLSASLTSGTVTGWRHAIVSDTSLARPQGDGDRVIAGWLRSGGMRTWAGPHPGVLRNSVPCYTVGPVEAYADIAEGPVRTGSFRTLGSFVNVFAIESFIDELAEHAGADPVAFRMAHLSDARARDVLAAVADAADWAPRVGPSGAGRGVALCQYDNAAGYVAVVADVTVDVDAGVLRADRLTLATDVGTMINREGVRQQVEGGAIQGVSRTLFERLAVDRRGVTARDFTSYPMLRFTDVPIVDVVLIDRPGAPPLGVGESSTPPVSAALANAIDDAIGVRMRALPITVEAIRDTVLTLDEAAARRVLVD